MSFLGLGATPDDDDNRHDDSSTSVIHQDSDDEDAAAIHDDDVDIGFRRHQYETFDDDDGNNNRKRRRRHKSRQESKEEALYGVFAETSTTTTTRKRSRTSDMPGGAPMFVAATTTASSESSDPPLFVSSTKSEGTANDNMFVKESTTSALAAATDKVDEIPKQQQVEDSSSKPPPEQEETPEEKEAQEKQKAADEYFQSLLQQAQDKKRRRRDQNVVSEPVVAAASTQNSFPTGSMLPQGFGRAHRPDAPPAMADDSTIAKKKDPGIAKWEKHEKGIGSKLLFKMGWKGSGGLGSNRRKLQSTTAAAAAAASGVGSQTTEDAVTPATMTTQPPATTAATTGSAEDAAKVRKGISRPVEVVVRPANMGLGFGSFKEQSQLKSNRQLEAEVRGVELPKTKKKKGVLDILEDKEEDHYDDDDDEEDLGPSTAGASSSIPTTQELMTQKAWKRRKTKRQAPIIIPYKELMAQHEKQNGALGQPVIIDMRGPSSSTAGTGTAATKDGKVPLGEELLHNVTFMLNTHENQLHSYSQIVKSTERKEASLQSEIEDLKRQQQEAQDRRTKLESALLVVQKVEDLSKEGLYGNEELDQVILWIQELGESFTAEDREALKFWQALAPAMLSPILQGKLERWDPLGSIERTKELLDSLFHIRLNDGSGNSSSQDQVALQELRYSILLSQLLPRIKQVLESSRWDPSIQTEIVLDMYEYLQSLTAKSKPKYDATGDFSEDQVLSGGLPDEDHAETSSVDNLAEIFRKDLVLDTIYPKLLTTLSRWKPSLTRGKHFGLEQRLDLWIMPWLPHLDHPAMLPNLLADCKRKLKNSLSYLQRKIGKDDDLDFVLVSTDTLRPWARVYDQKALQRLVSEYMTPYLGRALAKQKIHPRASDQDWRAVHLIFELHASGLLSDIAFLSVLEAELLPRWAAKVNDMLVTDEISYSEAATNYCHWKNEVMVNPHSKSTSLSLIQSIRLLKEDSRICGIFYTVLRMIQLAQEKKMDDLEDLHPPTTNYHVVSARRTKERQTQVQDDFVRMESRSTTEVQARLRLRRRQVDTPSFRDVVEEFASERGILFQPRMGSKALKDGKQVFLFGDVPIYIEGDVIYASQKGSSWQPTSLDQLIESSSGKE